MKYMLPEREKNKGVLDVCRMGITILTIVISGGVSSDTFANQVLGLRSRVVVKLDFGPFSR